MNNYEYIIASLPVLDRDEKNPLSLDVDSIVEEIRRDCSASDNALIDILLDSFDPDKLDVQFYRKALSSGNSFIRDYFRFDLNVRNAKVEYLNRELSRPADQDRIVPDEDEEFERRDETKAVLERTDILERERGLDELMWDCADSLTVLDVFNINVILGFLAKLRIIDRWLKLDPETGRELFRKLVDEVRKTR